MFFAQHCTQYQLQQLYLDYLNNLVVCDVTDQRYASYFGFTNNETQELLEYYENKGLAALEDAWTEQYNRIISNIE